MGVSVKVTVHNRILLEASAAHLTMVFCMGESTSVFIRRFVKLKGAYGDLRILTISRVKRILKIFFCFDFVPQSGPIHTPDHLQIHVF